MDELTKDQIEDLQAFCKKRHLDPNKFSDGYYPSAWESSLMEYDSGEVKKLKHKANFNRVDQENIKDAFLVLGLFFIFILLLMYAV
jgi:Trk-type K+ transport system membrane component